MGFGYRMSVATPSDPKLRHGRAWRGRCVVGGKVAAESADVTCTPVIGLLGIMSRLFLQCSNAEFAKNTI